MNVGYLCVPCAARGRRGDGGRCAFGYIARYPAIDRYDENTAWQIGTACPNLSSERDILC